MDDGRAAGDCRAGDDDPADGVLSRVQPIVVHQQDLSGSDTPFVKIDDASSLSDFDGISVRIYDDIAHPPFAKDGLMPSLAARNAS